MRYLPKPGDRVRVPFGFRTIDGEVLRASDFGIGIGIGIGPRVTVAVDVEGADEPITVVYPLDAVEISSAA